MILYVLIIVFLYLMVVGFTVQRYFLMGRLCWLLGYFFFIIIFFFRKAIFLKVTKILVFKLKWLSSGEKKWTLEIQDVCCWFLLQLWFSTW